MRGQVADTAYSEMTLPSRLFAECPEREMTVYCPDWCSNSPAVIENAACTRALSRPSDVSWWGRAAADISRRLISYPPQGLTDRASIRTTGDGFPATFDATTRAVRAALEIVTNARNIGLEVRSGVHIGEVEMRAEDIAGLAVSIARRICDLANAGEVLGSRPATEVAVGSGITFEDRGHHTLKGVPGTWQLFAAHT